MELPEELYTTRLVDGRQVSCCTMRQRVLHTIGLVDGCSSRHKPYTRHGKKFYRPWRNYFSTNAPDAEWESLCKEGYADHGSVDRRGVTYWLTPAGFAWIGQQIGVTILPERD